MNKKILGHRNITNKELPILASVLKKDEPNNEKVLAELNLIDDLLGLRKMEVIINQFGNTTRSGFKKKQTKNLHKVMEERIDIYLEEIENL